MPDEYYQRYQPLTHHELYDQLKAGVPSQVNGLVATWKSMEGSANALADSLRRDLGRLLPTWDSAAGREFQRRLGLVVSYAGALADDINLLHTSLTTMASALTEAQRKAEDPQATDDHDKTINGAAKGAAVGSILGPPGTIAGGVVGGIMGHDQDEEEKEKARERMVQLVALLAADYGVAEHTVPSTVAQAPVDLPDGDPDGTVDPAAAPHSGPPRQAPPTGAGDHSPTGLGLDGTTTPVSLPGSGGDGTATLADMGTSLQAAGSGLTGVGMSGVDGVLPGLAGPGGTVLSAGALGTAGALGAGALGVSGLAGAAGGAGPGRVDSAAGANRSGAGTPRGGRAAAGHSGAGDEDPADEHLTWLTEDDMVWGEGDAPASVIGTGQPAEQAEPGSAVRDE
jgi:hypothetical protein